MTRVRVLPDFLPTAGAALEAEAVSEELAANPIPKRFWLGVKRRPCDAKTLNSFDSYDRYRENQHRQFRNIQTCEYDACTLSEYAISVMATMETMPAHFFILQVTRVIYNVMGFQ